MTSDTFHLPWKVNQRTPAADIAQIADETGIRLIADVYGDFCRERAALIVRAVNAYDGLGGCHAPPAETRPAPSPDVVESIARRVEAVAADERKIGVFSTGEQIAVALVLDRKDLLPRGYDKGTWIEAIDRLGEEWYAAARTVQRMRDIE